ncbi:syntaxin-7-like [Rhopilema esculentum]|uniref:syntaxin-7-like n=1 Tax=Rhopilema esculentum TaxID=499914 RepID=UPI0031D6A489
MSKGDFGYGATVGASYQRPSGIDNFQSIFNDTSNKIFRINKNVSVLESTSKLFQAKSKSQDAEDRIHSVSQETNKLAKAAKNNFKLMSEYISSPTNYRFDPQGNKLMQNKLQQNKLKQEFENSLSRYQAIQNVLSVKLKSHIDEELHLSPVKHDVSQDNFNDSDDTLLINDVEQQAQLHAEEQELEAIKERENRFRQIETDILDVNEIFRDLAVIIHEQGDSIDSIEGNVEQAVVHVRDANVQLQRAKDYQKSARKRLCIICIVAFVAAGIIGLIIYLSEK